MTIFFAGIVSPAVSQIDPPPNQTEFGWLAAHSQCDNTTGAVVFNDSGVGCSDPEATNFMPGQANLDFSGCVYPRTVEVILFVMKLWAESPLYNCPVSLMKLFAAADLHIHATSLYKMTMPTKQQVCANIRCGTETGTTEI